MAKKEGDMPANTHPTKKLLFLEPVNGRSEKELTQAILRQLKRHGIKVQNKRSDNGKDKKNS